MAVIRKLLRLCYLGMFASLALPVAFPASGDEVSFVVAEAVFAREVNRDTKTYNRPLSSYLFAEEPPLFFWTRIQGGKAALERLVVEGKLPITHIWTRKVGRFGLPDRALAENELDALSIALEERIPTDLTSLAVLGKFGIEVGSHGTFDFRTWTSKSNLRTGVYEIRIVYKDNTPVLCNGEPCIYRICHNAAWCGD